jgi:hypothetical protein
VDAHHPACLPVAERRCLQRGVRTQHLFQEGGVGPLEGGDIPVEQRAGPLVGRLEQFRGLRLEFAQSGAGALQAALHRDSSRVEDFRGLGRGEGQHLTQDEDRALTGGEVLQARDERQPQ